RLPLRITWRRSRVQILIRHFMPLRILAIQKRRDLVRIEFALRRRGLHFRRGRILGLLLRLLFRFFRRLGLLQRLFRRLRFRFRLLLGLRDFFLLFFFRRWRRRGGRFHLRLLADLLDQILHLFRIGLLLDERRVLFLFRRLRARLVLGDVCN